MEKEKIKKRLELEISVAKDILTFIENQIEKGQYIGNTEIILTAHRKNYQRLLKDRAIIETTNKRDLEDKQRFFQGICYDLKNNGLEDITTQTPENPFNILEQIEKKLEVWNKWE